jgi:purine nucleosidase/pyrimidine-specific ribonucleoside hydrolase
MAVTTVTGNYSVDITSANARKITELLGIQNVPVARGMEKPLVRQAPEDPFSHGEDGLGNSFLPHPSTQLYDLHAVDVIIDTVVENPGEVTILALAPLTNLAMAFMKRPEIKGMIKEVISISGSYGFNKYAFENATGKNPQSEWNVFVDPEAAKIVFESGVRLKSIGLDVATNFDVNLSQEQIGEIKGSSKNEARLFATMLAFVQGRGFQSYTVLIDAMAVVALLAPERLNFVEGPVGVETKGELTLGQTIIDLRHHFTWTNLPTIQVGYDADYAQCIDLIVESLLV